MPLSPIIGWARVLSACLCEDLRGVKEEEETSWNRICWRGNSPIAGKCLSIKEAVQGVSMQECSNSLRVFSIFLFLSPHQCLIYLSSTKLYVNSGEIVFLTQFFFVLAGKPPKYLLGAQKQTNKIEPWLNPESVGFLYIQEVHTGNLLRFYCFFFPFRYPDDWNPKRKSSSWLRMKK